jgi:hypothetical protein
MWEWSTKGRFTDFPTVPAEICDAAHAGGTEKPRDRQ